MMSGKYRNKVQALCFVNWQVAPMELQFCGAAGELACGLPSQSVEDYPLCKTV